jgi:hypothetical protein
VGLPASGSAKQQGWTNARANDSRFANLLPGF